MTDASSWPGAGVGKEAGPLHLSIDTSEEPERTGSRTAARLAPRLTAWQERKAKKLMAEHLARHIDVGEVAQSCGISRGYFISAFCASAGVTPHQWLLCLRVRQAQQMLLSTDLPLVRIAIDCGFYDQSHFSRAFARRTGVPPGRWRRLNSAKAWHDPNVDANMETSERPTAIQAASRQVLSDVMSSMKRRRTRRSLPARSLAGDLPIVDDIGAIER